MEKFQKAVEIVARLVLDTIVLYTQTEKKTVIEQINRILGSRKKGVIDNYQLVQARNLKLRDMVYGGLIGNYKTGYSVTHKADGQRRMLVFLKNGIWLSGAPDQLTRISSSQVPMLTGSILDGEMIPKDKRNVGAPKAVIWFLAFDTIAWNGDISVQSEPHGKRMLQAQSVADNLKGDLLTVNTKTFRNISTPQEFFSLMREMFREQKHLTYQQDGFMFTPQNTVYNPHSDAQPLPSRKLNRYPDICKWKPKEELTIDLLIKWLPDENSEQKRTLQLYANQKGKPEIFLQSLGRVDQYNPMTLNLPDDTVVEYGYDYETQTLTPRRIRHDKSKPNRMEIAEDVWRDISTPIEKETMIGNNFTLLRRYHNRIKRGLLSVSRKCLLDIGTGRGGDINKWQGFDKIVAIEPNREHIQELEKRLENSNLRERVLIVEASGQDTKEIQQAVEAWCGDRVDIISFMLSLTFFWQSPELVQALCNTILTTLKPGGEILFLTMDGDLVEQTFEPAFQTGPALKQLQFGDIATLEYFGDKTPKELHIDIRDSIVTEQTEWLVRLDDLRRCLGPYGINKWELHKADEEKFLTEDEIIMTQMYTWGKAIHDGVTQLPKQSEDQVLTSSIIEESNGMSPLSTPPDSPVIERKPVTPLTPLITPSPKRKTLPKKIVQKLPDSAQRRRQDKMIPMNSISEVKAPWYNVGEKVVRIGAIGDGSCFFHSVLNAYLKIYQTNPSTTFRRKFVKDLRRDVSLTLSLPDPNNPNMSRYETASNGQFVALAEQQQQGLSFNDVFDQPVDFTLEGLRELFDSDMYLGDEIYSYLADLLGLDIYVMRLENGILKRHSDTKKEGENKKSVVISGNGYHFETIAVMRNSLYQTLFLPDDPFITGIQ
jgi:SAM-dependent methyltransferase